MTSGHVLELSSLPTRHPKCGDALLHQCGPSLIVRLSIEPTRQASGIMWRDVTVDWVAEPNGVEAVRHLRVLGWSEMPKAWDDVLVQWPIGVSPHELTEKAAIAAMALLIHDLAQGEIVRVLSIGSGGDYHIEVAGASGQVQVECSGILIDRTGVESRSRLSKKKVQVLKKCTAGFASVTTFSHTQSEVVHSHLHRVCRESREQKPRKARRK